MSIVLDDKEISDLTGRQRSDAQARVLRAMGIDFRTRPDGSLAVLRTVVEKAMGGSVTSTARKDNGPRFDLVR